MCCCNEKQCCQKPENLKDKPETCSKQQIEKCHGDVKEHPCTSVDCGWKGN
ncbi:MAG: hypothetical protein H8D56_00810 [Planctomycetes bacterium]|nr:hypothetical protein [Planctomycetota bacterium]